MKKINRLIPIASVSGISCLIGQSLMAKHTNPNVIIIVADDAGYGDFGFMGSTDIKTPNLDLLAAEGCYFTDAHVAATVSSPSRAMLLTGCYGQRFGYESNTSKSGDGLPQSRITLAEIVKPLGYHTACIGKWHLGDLPEQHPNKRGFDTFYGLIGGGRSYFYDEMKSDQAGALNAYQYNGNQIKFEGYFTDELTRRAKEIVSSNDQPFMMYLAYTAPHSPNEALPSDLEKFEGQPRQVYAAMMYALDRGVGEIVNELKANGKYDNTIIFFISDNGGATTNNSANDPLKGFKGNKFEGGHRVPLIVTWGDRFTHNTPFTGLTSSLDIFATVLDAVGVKSNLLKNDIDGISLLPYLTNRKKGDPHSTLYWRKMSSRAVRDGDYKLIMTQGVDTVMYNLKYDLGERTNLLHSEKKRAASLLKKLAKWESDVCIDPLWIEVGWADITNNIHRRLMKNEITNASDYIRKRE